jgi:hypothetical protein
VLISTCAIGSTRSSPKPSRRGRYRSPSQGLNSLLQTLDSLARLAGHDRAGGTEINVAVQTNVHLDLTRIAERLIERFDHEPDVKARIAETLLEMDDEQSP